MPNTSKSHPFIRLWGYARAHRCAMVLASLYSILNKVFDLAPPLLIGAAVDTVVQKQDSFLAQLGVPDVKTQLLVLAGLTVVIWVFESFFQYLYRVAWRNLAQSLQHDLRMDVYNHVQHLKLAYFEDRTTGGLLAVINDDINQLERFLNQGAHDIWRGGTTCPPSATQTVSSSSSTVNWLNMAVMTNWLLLVASMPVCGVFKLVNVGRLPNFTTEHTVTTEFFCFLRVLCGFHDKNLLHSTSCARITP